MHVYLLTGLEKSPVVFQRLLEFVPTSRVDERTDPDRFTFREAMAHLADWEPILLGRIRRALESPGAEVQGIDEGKRAEEQGYGGWDPKESLRRFAEARAETVATLRGLSPEQWDLHVIHSERGRMTVYDMANQFLGHDLYHLEHATQFLGAKIAATW